MGNPEHKHYRLYLFRMPKKIVLKFQDGLHDDACFPSLPFGAADVSRWKRFIVFLAYKPTKNPHRELAACGNLLTATRNLNYP